MESVNTMHWPGMTLEAVVGAEWVAVDDYEMDPYWQTVDAGGHGHFWKGAKTGKGEVSGGPENYPTLEWVAEPCGMGHGDGCTSEGFWRCRVETCHERVAPARRFVDGFWTSRSTAYRLTVDEGRRLSVYSFGETEWRKLRAKLAETIEAEMEPHRTLVELRG